MEDILQMSKKVKVPDVIGMVEGDLHLTSLYFRKFTNKNSWREKVEAAQVYFPGFTFRL
jgi:hypothetical protein